MPDEPTFGIDRGAVRKQFGRRAGSIDSVDAISREISSRMAERLDYIRITPRRVLDLGCGTGADRRGLVERYPDAMHVGMDFALPVLSRQLGKPAGPLRRLISRSRPPILVAGDAAALPLANASFGMIWSNLLLNWLDDPLPALREINRVLEIGGMVMFSTLGPDTLKELRAALPASSVHRFIDMHDLGDALVKAGFGDPVMDMQMLNVTYRSTDDLIADLRLGGHASVHQARPRGLRTPRTWRRQLDEIEAQRRGGQLPVTLELVFGHAWKVAPKYDDQGRSIIRFDKKPRP